MMYDLIVIGAGPAGYETALLAAKRNLKVLLFSGGKLGGVCLNEGCIPSKSLLHSAKLYNHISKAQKYGIYTENIKLDHELVLKRKNKVVKKLVAGIRSQLRTAGVEIIEDIAQVISFNPAEVVARDKTYCAHNIVLASGSTPVIPPLPGLEDALVSGMCVTSREILSLQEIPRHLVIVGGGVIGLEMAYYYRTLGSQVTIIEKLPHIGGINIDLQLAYSLQQELADLGIEFQLSATVVSIGENSVHYRQEQTYDLTCDKVLVSVGRKSDFTTLMTPSLLETLDRSTKFLSVNKEMQVLTKTGRVLEHVYAVGDLNGQVMLAHTGYREAQVAVDNICGVHSKMDYSCIPNVIYTDPEVAWVGKNLASAQKTEPCVSEFTLPLTFSGRYQAEVERGNGYLKLVYHSESLNLLGCQIIGSYASEIINQAALCIAQKMTLTEISEQVFAHPTVAECLKLAADQVLCNIERQ